MKLLLDENLSRRMVPFLQNMFPGSSQVALLNLAQRTDLEIWEYAKSKGFAIVTRDADFEELSSVLGAPPKVIWLRIPNQSKSAVLNLFAKHQTTLCSLLDNAKTTCIELGSEGIIPNENR